MLMTARDMPRKRASRKVFSDAENERLRKIVERLVDKYGNQTRVAEVLAVTQPTISAFMIRRQGASVGLARAIAAEVGTSFVDLVGWSAEGDEAAVTWPVRDSVVAALRTLGFSEETLGALEKLELRGENATEPDALFYVRWACLQEEQRAFAEVAGTRRRPA